MVLLFSAMIFFSLVLIGLAIRYMVFPVEETKGQTAKRRLRSLRKKAAPSDEARAISLMRQTSYSNIGLLNRLIGVLPRLNKLQELLRQAGNPFDPGVFFMLCGGLALVGLIVGLVFSLGILTIILPFVGAYLPIMFLKKMKQRRLNMLEEQFPEAVDLMARALRAGHSFGSALKMSADEIGEPLKTEFSKTFEDYSYGKTMEDALEGLTKRVDLEDIRFFATAVSLQRETGGNLTDILDNIGYIIRERFRLLRTVKALSAEGRLSGTILAILAPALAGLLWFLSPGYMNMALEHPLGKMMLLAGAGFELLGILVIKKLIKLDV